MLVWLVMRYIHSLLNKTGWGLFSCRPILNWVSELFFVRENN